MTEIKNITAALLKVQEEITNPANTAKNPFFNSKYAPLPDILNLTRPLLSKNGIVLIQNVCSDGTDVQIQTILIHESGETIETEKLVLKPDPKKDKKTGEEKVTVQSMGSAITYGRRYQLTALLGISGEDDDDGNGDKPLKSPNRGTRPTPQTRTQGADPKTRNTEPPSTSTTRERPKRQRTPRQYVDEEIKHLKQKNEWLKKAINILEEDNVEITRISILKVLENMLGDSSMNFELDTFREAKTDLRANY